MTTPRRKKPEEPSSRLNIARRLKESNDSLCTRIASLSIPAELPHDLFSGTSSSAPESAEKAVSEPVKAARPEIITTPPSRYIQMSLTRLYAANYKEDLTWITESQLPINFTWS